MLGRVRQTASLARTVLLVARRIQLPFLAAAVAYYAFLSLLPLLALALVASTAIGGPDVVDRLLSRFEAVLTPATEDLLREALEGGTGRLGVSVAGTLVVLWSSLRVMRALDTAFSMVYGVEFYPSLPKSLLNGVVVLAGIPLGIALTAAVPIVVRLFPLGPFQRVAAVLGGIVALAVVFLPMYVVFPSRRIRIRHAVPGAVVAAVGWSSLGAAFSLYVALAGNAPLYGPLGGMVLLLMTLYAGATLLLLGAVLNATVGGHRQLQQAARRQSAVARTMPEETEQPSTPDEPTDEERDARDADEDRSAGRGTADDEEPVEFDPEGREPGDRLRDEVADLRSEVEAMRENVESRTVHREDVERDLRRYVRRRVRRGHARGWGPYLVLLYGTAMTLGAFQLLEGGWALAAMIVIWLSTLGLYTLMVLVGATFTVAGVPGRLRDGVQEWRS